MDVKSFWITRDRFANRGEFTFRDASVNFHCSVVAPATIRVPIFRKLAHRRILLQLQSIFLRRIQLLPHTLHDRLRINADFLGINLPELLMCLNLSVAQWLRDRGIVPFAMTMPPIAD